MENINQHLETIKKLAVELRKVENLNEMADAYKDRVIKLEELTSNLLDCVDQCITNSNELLIDNKEAIECYRKNNLILHSRMAKDFSVIRAEVKSQRDQFDAYKKDFFIIFDKTYMRLQEELGFLLKHSAYESKKYNKIGLVFLVSIIIIQIFTTIYLLWIK